MATKKVPTLTALQKKILTKKETKDIVKNSDPVVVNTKINVTLSQLAGAVVVEDKEAVKLHIGEVTNHLIILAKMHKVDLNVCLQEYLDKYGN